MPDTLFISYKSQEDKFALQLAAALKNRGIHIWIDRMDIKPADNWIEAISAALQACNGMIAILTPDYFRSQVCLDELNTAYTNQRLIIPLLLRPNIEERDTDLKVPFWLSHRQRLDFTDWLDDKAFQAKIEQLVERIERDQQSSVGDLPSPEIQYLTTLISDLESQQGVENYIALSTQSEVVRVDPRPRKNIDPSLALLLKPPTPERDLHPETKKIENIQQAVADHAKFVLIGDPGAGKTTTLRRLALEMARARLEYLTALGSPPYVWGGVGGGVAPPLPFIAYLPRWSSEPTAADFIRRQWAATNIGGDVLRELQSGHIWLYLDGLNEMGGEGKNKAALLRNWLQSPDGPRRAIITCRQADYHADLRLGDIPTVLVESLTDEKIREFVGQYLGDEQSGAFLEKVFPPKNLYDWERDKIERRSLIHLARNPYLLAALTLIFEYGRDLPRNTGALFHQLAQVLSERERLRQTPGWIPFGEMQAAFANLAFSMIDEDQPIDVPLNYAEAKLGNIDLLDIGRSANLITINTDKMRFSHQLMLEYFAAHGLLKAGLTQLENIRFGKFGRSATKWDEVVVALCGIVSDPTLVLIQLASIDMFLVAECLTSGIVVSDPVRKEIIAMLLKALRDSAQVRAVAARGLGKIGTPAIPGLLEALSDPSGNVRSSAAQALGRIGDATTVPALQHSLGDTERGVRLAAAQALGNIGGPMAVLPLLDVLHDEDKEVRLGTVQALGQIGSLAVPPLLKALQDSDWEVRDEAAQALGQIGSLAVLPLLKALQDSDWEVRKDAAETLGNIGDPTTVLPLLEVLCDSDKEVRLAATQALGQIGDPSAVPTLIELLANTEKAHDYGDARVCDITAFTLEKIGTPEALEAVRHWREEQNKSDG